MRWKGVLEKIKENFSEVFISRKCRKHEGAKLLRD
jgi:hypothetical protein